MKSATTRKSKTGTAVAFGNAHRCEPSARSAAFRRRVRLIPESRPGLALPMTIIAIAGLTLLLIGLLTVLTLERKTARSYSDAARAEFAVESGLAVALGSLTEIASRDDSIVFRIEDPVEPTVASTERPLGYREQFFTYGAIYENDAWRGLPLFSGSPEIALGSGKIEADLLNTELTAYSADAEQLGRLTEHDQNIPRAKWVEVPAADPNGYTMRYAFWVEDLSGRIDGKNAGTIPRAEGQSTAELDYATIIEPTADDPDLPETFKQKRDKLLTPASIRPLFTGPSEDAGKRLEPYLHFLPTPTGPAPPKIIPQGFGYAEAGSPAHDLNELVENKDVEGIADIINLNIPTFEQRKGGFPDSDDYVKTLAASIIDYADTDSDPTSGGDPANGDAYRGVDSYPFVTELADRYTVVNPTSTTPTVSVESYVELWNPSQLTITGTMGFTHKNAVRAARASNNEPFYDFDSPTFPDRSVTIPPNGYVVLFLGDTRTTFNFGPGINASIYTKGTFQSNYELRWNGKLVDYSAKGVAKPLGQLQTITTSGNEILWKSNPSPSLDLSDERYGNPRMSVYYDYRNPNLKYERGNWGGRAKMWGHTNVNTNELRMSDWPDRGADSAPGVPPSDEAVRPAANVPGSVSNALSDGTPYPQNQPNYAISYISNAGKYSSIAELGHIFDPVMWLGLNAPFDESEEDSSKQGANREAGGGTTLAIGRPEYSKMDRDGMRASQLLDLFHAENSPSTTSQGQININTAPREVLRSLIADVSLGADPLNPDLKLPNDNEIGDLFADYVITTRSKNPLRGVSDFSSLRKETAVGSGGSTIKHFFGTPETYIEDKPPETWTDRGREELFRKTVESHHYDIEKFQDRCKRRSPG